MERCGAGRAEPMPEEPELGPDERRGIRRAGLAALLVIVLIAALALTPGYSPLIDESKSGTGRIAAAVRFAGAGIRLAVPAAGIAYGKATGSIRTPRMSSR